MNSAQHQDLRILRMHDVLKKTGLGRSSLYNRIRAGKFPPAVSLGGNAVGWPEFAVDEWIAQRMREAGYPVK